jgi:hypothetical protein
MVADPRPCRSLDGLEATWKGQKRRRVQVGWLPGGFQGRVSKTRRRTKTVEVKGKMEDPIFL